MRLNSLAFRLFATAAAWTCVVLPIAGFIIYRLYQQDIYADHDRRIDLLLSSILLDSIDAGGNEPGQPNSAGEKLVETERSGWYWQISPLDVSAERPGRRLSSPSLVDQTLPLIEDPRVRPDAFDTRWTTIDGPFEQRLRLAERIYSFGEGDAAQRYAVSAAGWMTEPDARLAAFRARLSAALALAGIGLVAVTLFQVRFGLHPLQRVERGLAAIRSGTSTRLEGELPGEIVSLQNELNALLKSNEDIIERARREVGNLAHGLKTPLAVLQNEAHEHPGPLGAKVAEQVMIMRDQVNHYLDRARVAAQTGVIGRVTDVKLVAEAISRALERIHRGKDLAFDIDCRDEPRFQGERQDLEEMLGNLLDNAAKWSHGRVRLAARVLTSGGTPRMLEIVVEDDGPGLTAEQLAAPIQRGRRLDETKPGSGLGLSIVADLVHAYGGRLALSRSELGGLAARLTLPAA
jgi:signal transduction histidine kinase